MIPSLRSHLRTALILLLAVGLLAWFLSSADLREVWREIRRARADMLALGLVVTLLTYVLRALRWQYLLRPIGRTSFVNVFRATVIGFAATFLLPARAGEFLRPYLLARREGLSATAAFATIILERLLDTIAVLLLFASFVLAFDPGMSAVDPRVYGAIKAGGLAVAVISVLTLGALYYLAGHPASLQATVRLVETSVPGRIGGTVGRLVKLFTEGLAIVRQPGRLLVAVALSFPLWLSIATSVWAGTLAFHIEMPYTGSFLLMALLVVGVAVPTPGAVGGFHQAYRIGVTSFYAAPTDRAVGAAIVLHAISFLPVTLIGIFFLAQDGLTIGRMRRLAGLAGVEGESSEVPVLRPSGR